jgi:hypothetical protein
MTTSKKAPHGGSRPEGREPREARGAIEGGLSDTQVMTMLEQRRAPGANAHLDAQSFKHVPMLRPEDTSTRLVLKEAVNRGDPVSFAVQLLSSPQPIELSSTPRDPIFRSYTVYTTRVRYDGREWFELRMGFFSDAISAKQVAHYMQSQYDSAAVVPVNPQEQAAALAAANAARAARRSPAPAAAVATPAPDTGAPAATGRPHLSLIRRAGRGLV